MAVAAGCGCPSYSIVFGDSEEGPGDDSMNWGCRKPLQLRNPREDYRIVL
jgi:hypothetical protein